MHFCPAEITLIMMMVEYLTTTYHYYVCGFKNRFLGADQHDLSDHYTDNE